jgi:hypothetical protein
MHIVTAAILLAASLPAAAQVYKCVDSRGKAHYSDQPVAGCKAQTINVQPSTATSVAPRPLDRSERTTRIREQAVQCGQARQALQREGPPRNDAMAERQGKWRETLRDCS